jgi:hypothetical protein
MPIVGKTVVQVSDIKLKPQLAMQTLEMISGGLREANRCFQA